MTGFESCLTLIRKLWLHKVKVLYEVEMHMCRINTKISSLIMKTRIQCLEYHEHLQKIFPLKNGNKTRKIWRKVKEVLMLRKLFFLASSVNKAFA